MPKIKTTKAAAKRFKKTASGLLKRNKAYKSHILTKKSTKRKRNLRQATITDATNVKNMKKILPYPKNGFSTSATVLFGRIMSCFSPRCSL